MKKQLILALSLLLITGYASAQKQFKLAKSSGRLTLNLNGAIIEGYNGNEIIFSAVNTQEAEVDERAKGLRAISGSGFSDNTGLGIEVTDKGQEVTVNSVSKKMEGQLTIKVPQGVKVVFNNSSNLYQDDVTMKNLQSEIEVSTSFNKIILENNTGPMNIKSLHGTVDAVFSGEIKGPISIISVHGYVDVTMPTSTKANVEISTSHGNLYAADQFKIAIEKPVDKVVVKQNGEIQNISITGRSSVATGSQGPNVSGIAALNPLSTRLNGVVISAYGSRDAETIKGKINGGGIDLVLKSNFQNVYLRTK